MEGIDKDHQVQLLATYNTIQNGAVCLGVLFKCFLNSVVLFRKLMVALASATTVGEVCGHCYNVVFLIEMKICLEAVENLEQNWRAVLLVFRFVAMH